METDEIIMVLAQASKLHAKIEDAIERVLQYDTEINGENAAPAADEAQGGCVNGGKFSQSEMGVDGAMEARSLSSIRDALEVLEDQLDCFQILLQQQQADREAALSDLGESKRIFLGRLRRYQGREREVVDEALAFAGEPTVENDSLHQPPHPTLLPERLSFARSDEEHAQYYEDPDISLKNDAIKSLGWREETEEEKDSGLENSQTCRGVVADVYIKNDQTECKGIFSKVLCQSIERLQKPIVHAVSFAAKTALVVASIATVAVLTTVVNSKLSKESMRKAHSSPSAVALSSPSTGPKKSANLVKLHDSLEGL
uniref:Plastid division protein PDV2 n=1 Tax=Picea sitchensis TaxID=3332 RepID=A9NP43_PICSI|nr:unknown [Picea sitchensis]